MEIVAFLVLGLLVGVFSGIVGIGGGVLIIPSLVYLFKFSQHKAQGTSLGALLAPIGLFAALEYSRTGNIDWKAALLIAFGFLIGGWFGARWAQSFSDVMLRRVFAVLLVAIAAKMFFTK